MMTDEDRETRVAARPVQESRTVRRRRVVRAAAGPRTVPKPRPAADEPAVPEDATVPEESTVDIAAEPETGPAKPAKKSARKTAVRGADATQLRRWRIAAVVLLVALVAALAAAGVLGRRWYDRQQLDAARQQALAAARQTTVNFVSISATTVDRDLQRISAGATGQFKDEFTGDMGQIRAAVLANKVDSQGTVLRAAVVSLSTHSAVILVAVDATVKNTNAPDGRLSHYRIQVNLARDAHTGRWLVAQLQFVG